jgi:hypothetical protein
VGAPAGVSASLPQGADAAEPRVEGTETQLFGTLFMG